MIRYKEINNTLYLTAKGHITAQFCSAAKEAVFSRLDRQPQLENFYIDLIACTYMDSTFIGLLAGFNKRFKTLSGKKIIIQNLSPECLDLLDSMGLTQILNISQKPVEFPPDMITITQAEQTKTKDVLQAHEDLMDISDENKKKFATLHSVLKASMDDSEQK